MVVVVVVYHELDLKLPVSLILDAMHLLRGAPNPFLEGSHAPTPMALEFLHSAQPLHQDAPCQA